MLQQESLVVVADNTQAKKAKIIRVLKGSYGKIAHVGDRVVVAIKEATPAASVKKGQVCQAVVVRTRKRLLEKMVLILDLLIMQ